MVILSSVVNLVFRFLSTVLGETPPTLGELAQPIAFSLIAIGVLLYHGSSLRNDRQLLLQGQVALAVEGPDRVHLKGPAGR